MAKKKLILIRHGEVEEAYQGKFVGRIDADLSADGRRQMKKFSDYFATIQNVQYICSPLKRALDSFEIATQKLPNCKCTADVNFKEIHFGNWEGLSFQQIKRRYPDLYKEWKMWRGSFRYPQGESHNEFIRRIRRCAKAIKKMDSENVVVFSHGGVIRFLLCYFLELDFSQNNAFKVERGSRTILEISRIRTVLAELNFK